MRIKLIPEATLEALKESVADNLQQYRNGIPFSFEDAIDTKLEVDMPAISMDKASDGKTDTQNVQIVFEAFKSLPLPIIRDERFWAHLTHVEFAEYTRSRWPLPSDDEKAVKRVESRYFASSDRSIENRNAMSRLYWIGYVANRYPGDLRSTIEVITHQQDVTLNFIERPGVLQVPAVFNALVSRLIESRATDQVLLGRNTFREALKQLNLACGSAFVEALPDERVAAIVDEVLAKVLPEPESAPVMGM